jgi:cytidylate kinase
MSATTITFSVQLGSGGFAIARQVADKLGFRYYDWEVTSQAADEAGVSPEVVASAERVPSLAERIMERFFNAGFYAGDIPEAVVPTSTTMDTALQTLNSANYREMMAQVVRDLAGRGSSVIVGHAGQVVLRGQPDVLKVLIHGSKEIRTNRLVVDEGLSPEQAAEAIKQSDNDRAKFFSHYYKLNWLDASHYDLTLGTDTLADEQATAIVLDAAHGLVAAKA